MAQVKDQENAKIRYDYSKIPGLMATKNYLKVYEGESVAVLGKSIKLAATGSYVGQKDPGDISNATIPSHVGMLGFFCRIGSVNKKKYVEIWHKMNRY